MDGQLILPVSRLILCCVVCCVVWQVIQRRGDYGLPRENFSVNWRDYKLGFGQLDREFWFGNDFIHRSVRPFFSPLFFWGGYFISLHFINGWPVDCRLNGCLRRQLKSTTHGQHIRCADAILILLIFLVFLLPTVEKQHKPNFKFYFSIFPFDSGFDSSGVVLIIVVQINQRTRRGAARGTVGL